MPSKFFQFKKNLFLAILLLVIFVLPSKVLAENWLTVGSASSSLSGTDSAIFANVSSASPTSTFLLMLRSGSIPKFSVDQSGNVSTPGTIAAGSFTGPLTGTISAGNISSGTFGANTGLGNFYFPASVGIGTTTPGQALHISGSSAQLEFTRTGATTADFRFIPGYSAISNTFSLYNNVAASYSWVVDANQNFLIPSGNLIVSGTGNSSFAGNVGIGTTDPSVKFVLQHSGSRYLPLWGSSTADMAFGVKTNSSLITGMDFYNENSAGQVRLMARNNNNDYVMVNAMGTTATANFFGQAGDQLLLLGVGKRLAIGTNGATSLIFGTSNTERMRISANGNVGIGSSTPNYKFVVNGDANFSGYQIHNLGAPATGTDAANRAYVDSVLAPAATTTPGLQSGFWTTGANGSIFNNNSSGKVGIGTTAPSQRLTVESGLSGNALSSGSTQTNGTLRLRGGNNGVLDFGINGSGSAWLQAVDRTGLSTNYSLLLNPNGGSVGIGTTTPGSLLTVGNNLGLTTGGTIYGSLVSRYLDLSGVLPLSLNVPGPIKFGNTANACDSTNTGALRYDPISGQSYLCDGSRWLNQKNCGLMTDDDGNTYGTVQIGGQCWMAENINVGTTITAGASLPNTSDQTIEKWCYGDNASNCSTYGGLYHYDEVMRGSKVAGARGICPAGWHVPTDAEFNILEKTVLGVIASPNSQYACNMSVTGWQRCADNSGTDAGGTYGVGKSLKAVGVGSGVGAGNDLVGFNGRFSGRRNTDGSFNNLTSYLYLWSSTPSGSSNAWRRIVTTSYSTVNRSANSRASGFSVRCLRD